MRDGRSASASIASMTASGGSALGVAAGAREVQQPRRSAAASAGGGGCAPPKKPACERAKK
jgi:hypothetical protein